MPDDPQATQQSAESGSRRSAAAGPSGPSGRATAAPDEMEDQTPRTPGDQLVNSDSRLNALRDAGPKRRQQLVWIQYEGRKGSTGATRRVADEHIDLTVPDEDNEAAADLYLDQVSPAGVITPQTKQLLKDQGISHETLQMSGTSYHFHANSGPTPVDPSHTDWLLNHPGLKFSQVDAP